VSGGGGGGSVADAHYILVGVVEEVEVDEFLDLERLRGDVLDDLAAGKDAFVHLLLDN